MEFIKLMRQFLNNENDYIAPIPFWYTLCKMYTEYKSMQQQDSFEFLTRLLYATDICQKVTKEILILCFEVV